MKLDEGWKTPAFQVPLPPEPPPPPPPLPPLPPSPPPPPPQLDTVSNKTASDNTRPTLCPRRFHAFIDASSLLSRGSDQRAHSCSDGHREPTPEYNARGRAQRPRTAGFCRHHTENGEEDQGCERRRGH